MATKVKAQAVKESVKDEPKAADAPEKERRPPLPVRCSISLTPPSRR